MCRFVFVKQKTAYEMRISDWSSDVCSSDLTADQRWLSHRWNPAAGGRDRAERAPPARTDVSGSRIRRSGDLWCRRAAEDEGVDVVGALVDGRQVDAVADEVELVGDPVAW